MKQALSKRENRHRRIRAKLKGGSIRPRISVFRSSKHISIQLIDDEKNKTLFGVSDIKIKKGTKTERAKNLGKEGARKILELGKNEFDKLPFAKRWIQKKVSAIKIEPALRELISTEALWPYKILKEQAGGMVAQSEHTIIVGEKPIVTTRI